jgi:prepilin-type N-terminal cleavage/methylation domain-containing protein
MRRRQHGFTLIELMVVVAIISVLAAIAVPSFMRNARKARTSEALVQVNKIYLSSRTYILEPHAAPGSSTPLAPGFPSSEAMTPAGSCCVGAVNKCSPFPPDFKTPTWEALQFSIDDPHYYHYAYTSTGPSIGSTFTAQAFGDLNCDGTYSTFEMAGAWSSADHDVHGSAGFYMNNPLE